jgi:hypothetical protein
MGKYIGEKIRRSAPWVLLAGVLCSCAQFISDWFGALQMVRGQAKALFADKIWFYVTLPILLKFCVCIFASYLVSLLISGIGCIIEDNHEKAQAAKELNFILSEKNEAEKVDKE